MKHRYDPHAGVAMVRKWLDELRAKSGRDIDEWTELVLREGPSDTKSRKAWLKSAHGLGTNSANWIVDRAEGRDVEEGDPEKYVAAAHGYVEAMFSGAKAALLPLYDALYREARALGDDIRVSPGKTIVPIYRHHVIAQIKPSTRTRIDFGLALGNLPATGRLFDTGGFAKKDRITHRIAVTSPSDIDDELRRWLRKAYELDA